MTVEELIKAGKSSVRNSPALMAQYKILFKQVFGREPDCAGCTFNRDWERLANNSQKKLQVMSDKTFRLKKPGIIYSLDIEDKKLKRTIRRRVYGNIMSEDFANDFLSIGSKSEIEERKKLFAVLPEKFRTETDSENDFSKLKVVELKALAIQEGYPEEEWVDLKKDELIAYLNAKSIDSDEVES